MLKKLPDFVENYISTQLHSDNVIISTKDVSGTGYSRLAFNSEGFAKVTEGKIQIFSYIIRLINHSRKDMIVYVNDVQLDHIPFLLTHDINKEHDAG